MIVIALSKSVKHNISNHDIDYHDILILMMLLTPIKMKILSVVMTMIMIQSVQLIT